MHVHQCSLQLYLKQPRHGNNPNEYQEMIHVANLVDGLVENDKYGNIILAEFLDDEIFQNLEIE